VFHSKMRGKKENRCFVFGLERTLGKLLLFLLESTGPSHQALHIFSVIGKYTKASQLAEYGNK